MEVEVLDIGKKIYEKYISDGADKLCNTLKEMEIEDDYGRRAMYCYVVFKELKVLETLKNIDKLDIFDNYRPYLIMNYVRYIKKNTDNLKNITETFIGNFNYVFLNSYMLNEKELRLYIKMLTDVEVPKYKMENLMLDSIQQPKTVDNTKDFENILKLLNDIKDAKSQCENSKYDSVIKEMREHYSQLAESINANTELEFEKQKLEYLDFNNKVLDHFKENYDILQNLNIDILKYFKNSCITFAVLSVIISLIAMYIK